MACEDGGCIMAWGCACDGIMSFRFVMLCGCLGITRDHQHTFFQLLAAILYMGNIQFEQKPNSDAAAVITHDTITSSCRLPSSLCLTQCALLLGCSVDTLSHSLCSRLFVAGGRGEWLDVRHGCVVCVFMALRMCVCYVCMY